MRFFLPLLRAAKNNGVGQVVFLSVQGAEKSKVIPHNKIERLIVSMGFGYFFMRPSFFMQNLTTTLLPEILKHKTITLPSGKSKFNWVDVKNIGEAAAVLIQSFGKHANTACEITGTENMNFGSVVALMTDVMGTTFKFKSVNPISFYMMERKKGKQSGFVLVMAMLHFLPRLQREPQITDTFYQLTGKKATTLKEFIKREKRTFAPEQQ